jgi:hypothetical protein
MMRCSIRHTCDGLSYVRIALVVGSLYEYPAPLCRIPITCQDAVGVAGLRGCLRSFHSGTGNRQVCVCVCMDRGAIMKWNGTLF